MWFHETFHTWRLKINNLQSIKLVVRTILTIIEVSKLLQIVLVESEKKNICQNNSLRWISTFRYNIDSYEVSIFFRRNHWENIACKFLNTENRRFLKNINVHCNQENYVNTCPRHPHHHPILPYWWSLNSIPHSIRKTISIPQTVFQTTPKLFITNDNIKTLDCI